jgi:hypothetical protein
MATWKVDVDPSLMAFFDTEGKSVTSRPFVPVVVLVVVGNKFIVFKA